MRFKRKKLYSCFTPCYIELTTNDKQHGGTNVMTLLAIIGSVLFIANSAYADALAQNDKK